MRSFPAGIFAPAIAATGAMPRSRVQGLKSSNAPGRIPTSDQQLRRLLLYPPELRAPDSRSFQLNAALPPANAARAPYPVFQPYRSMLHAWRSPYLTNVTRTTTASQPSASVPDSP